MVAELTTGAKTYKMVFGMVATEIIGATWLKALENGTNSQLQSVAIVVFGGVCNYAEMNLEQKPKFPEIYQFVSDVAEENTLELDRVYAIWEETKPAKQMMTNLSKVLEQFGIKKKEVPANQKRKTGMK